MHVASNVWKLFVHIFVFHLSEKLQTVYSLEQTRNKLLQVKLLKSYLQLNEIGWEKFHDKLK